MGPKGWKPQAAHVSAVSPETAILLEHAETVYKHTHGFAADALYDAYTGDVLAMFNDVVKYGGKAKNLVTGTTTPDMDWDATKDIMGNVSKATGGADHGVIDQVKGIVGTGQPAKELNWRSFAFAGKQAAKKIPQSLLNKWENDPGGFW